MAEERRDGDYTRRLVLGGSCPRDTRTMAAPGAHARHEHRLLSSPPPRVLCLMGLRAPPNQL
ncbi:hypothetical protein K466DRAFT_584668 [Polyporus arcularius HHB13444]|uniref:Uncharacterized protein n=1 Tax=Polyporus arcularius HHB13444 TaxID=1314778 RepID=A0A5C3PJB1_9APHY|nr:hypothetical protein K466DRAFT_584668 [Polyporus arcularius HHB13444]